MRAHPIALAIFESHILIQNTVRNQCCGSGPVGSVSCRSFRIRIRTKKCHGSTTLFALRVVNPDPYPKLLAPFRSGSAPKNITDPLHCLHSESWIRIRTLSYWPLSDPDPHQKISRIHNTVCAQCRGSWSVSFWLLSDPYPTKKCNRSTILFATKAFFPQRLLRERSRDASPSHRAGLLWPARLSLGGGGDRRSAHHACAQARHHRGPPANLGSAPGVIHIYYIVSVLDPDSFDTGTDPDPGFWWPKIKKIFSKKNLNFFWIKNYTLSIPRPLERTSKLQNKPSAFKREHPALKNMKFLNFFYWISWIQIRIPNRNPLTWLNPDPDPKHCI
jgi:hypothetical protein